MQRIGNCKICQSRSGQLTLKKYYANSSAHHDLKAVFGEQFMVSVGLRLCGRCGFVYHDNILSPAELYKLYLQEDRITGRTGSLQKDVLIGRATRFLKKAFDFARMSNGIDIGSGDFSLLESLAHDFPKVRFDAVNVSYPDDRRGNIRVFHAMLEDMEKPADTYQLVILSHILEHIADFEAFFGGLKKVATEGTRLYVEVPFQVGPSLFLDRGFHAQHINYFTPLTLAALLKRFGYAVERLEFDTQGGYFFYGLPGIIRAKFIRDPETRQRAESLWSVVYSMFFLINPLIFISGWLRSRLIKDKRKFL